MLAFDVHQHLGSLHARVDEAAELEAASESAARREVMAEHAIACGAALAPPVYDRTNGWQSTRALNKKIAEYVGSHSERFPVGFGIVEPLHSRQSSLDEIIHLDEELGLRGIVWHHKFHGVAIDDATMDPLVDAAHARGLRLLVHVYADSTLESPFALMRLALRHPEVPMVALDAFTSVSQAKELPGIAERCPNILFETAGAFPLGRLAESFARRVGSDRLIYGSQLYVNPQWWLEPHVLTEIRKSPWLTESDKQQILWQNSAKLFDLDPTRFSATDAVGPS